MSPSSEIPNFTLYTNHGCPWAHRAHIALTALGLPYEEVIIPLDKPREPWYLEIQPRGLVPALKVEHGGSSQVFIESAIVANFLLELSLTLPTPYSSIAARLNPSPNSFKSALQRANNAFVIDTFATKYVPFLYQLIGVRPLGAGEDIKTTKQKFVDTISKELEPHFASAAPFFGGSTEITAVEVLSGPFILRSYAYIKHGLISASLAETLAERVPHFDAWAKAVVRSETVRAKIWDEAENVEKTKARIEKLKNKA